MLVTMSSFSVTVAVSLFFLVELGHGQSHVAGIRGQAILELNHADRVTRIGPIANGTVIDVTETPYLNIKAAVTADHGDLPVSSFSFLVNGELARVDNSNPAWMVGAGGWNVTERVRGLFSLSFCTTILQE
jgi:hypothetical protein